MDQFFEVLQVSLGNKELLSRKLIDNEWVALFDEASKQALIGVLLAGVKQLPKDQLPPRKLFLKWIGAANQIDYQNQQLTSACSKICNQIEEDGFCACILKGQSNHAYYPDEFANWRSPGDVDVWVVAKKNEKHPVKKVIEYVEDKYPVSGKYYLHASFDDDNGIPIEVHFRPSFMNDPFCNRCFQKYFSDFEQCVCRKEIDGVSLPVLKIEYDVVFQITHIYRHLLDEGVGLRQVVDYFFVLKQLYLDLGEKKEYKASILRTISDLGMRRFAGALMWVLNRACGMPKEWNLCEPNEKNGSFLLSEIMLAGNFGQADSRLGQLETEKGELRFQLSREWRRLKRIMKFLTSYPREVFWEPYARIARYAWKKLELWRI